MRLSTKGRYGLRALIDLAIHSRETHIALASVAERQNISAIYLEQVFSILRKTGIVKSIKGAQGGYQLADEPQNITIGAILRALEGDLSLVDSQVMEGLDTRSIAYNIKLNIWDRIDERINALVDSLTLEDMIKEYEQKNHKDMFYI